MQSTNREMKLPRLLAQLAIAAGLGVMFAIIGPFGTYGELGATARYAYWIGLVLVGYLNIVLCAHALARFRPAWGQRWSIPLVTLLSAVPTSFAVAWAESLLRLGHPVALAVMPRVYGSVAVVQLVVLLLLTRLQPAGLPLVSSRSPVPADLPPQPEPEPVPPPFLARIPAHLGGQLLALQAEDHYLRVITTQGSDLILMRMADALRELEGEPGLQVHRSWWVAHRSVCAVKRDAGKTVLELSNGLQVPVSRTYQAAVRAAPFEAATAQR